MSFYFIVGDRFAASDLIEACFDFCDDSSLFQLIGDEVEGVSSGRDSTRLRRSCLVMLLEAPYGTLDDHGLQ